MKSKSLYKTGVEMNIKKLSKLETLRLVTPVIDGEACEETQRAFFENLRTYPEVQYYFKSALIVKKLMKDECPRAKVTADFHQRIRLLIASQLTNEFVRN